MNLRGIRQRAGADGQRGRIDVRVRAAHAQRCRAGLRTWDWRGDGELRLAGVAAHLDMGLAIVAALMFTGTLSMVSECETDESPATVNAMPLTSPEATPGPTVIATWVLSAVSSESVAGDVIAIDGAFV